MVNVRTEIKLPISYNEALEGLKMLDKAFRKANPDLFVNTASNGNGDA